MAAGIASLQLRKQPLHSLGESDVWDVGNVFLPHQFRLSASGSALVVAGFVPGAGLQGALCSRSGQSPGLGSRSPGKPNCVYCSCKNFLVWVLLVLQPMAKSPWETLLSSSQPPLPRHGPRWLRQWCVNPGRSGWLDSGRWPLLSHKMTSGPALGKHDAISSTGRTV